MMDVQDSVAVQGGGLLLSPSSRVPRATHPLGGFPTGLSDRLQRIRIGLLGRIAQSPLAAFVAEVSPAQVEADAAGDIRWSPWPLYLGIPLAVVPLVVFGLCRRGSRRATTDGGQRRSWQQFSLSEMLVLVAVVCLFLWLIRLNSILALVCSVIAFAGGGIAWLWSRRRRAWLIGAVLSLYGGFLGLLSWATLSDVAFSPLHRQDPHLVLGTLLALDSIGAVLGGLLGGWLKKRVRNPRHAPIHQRIPPSR